MNSSPHRKTYPLSTGNIVAMASVAVVFSWVAVCFCSLIPLVLLMSLLFNTLVLGSGLFSALAQEREKRTIDALRLTQLTSFDILRYKAHGEFKAWRAVNIALLGLTAVAALATGTPLVWSLAGASALACGGLLSIALALAVSTRCETTSSAVVTGWVTKGVWLVGLPILDYVVESVLVMNKDLNFFSYLDPAWVYGNVVGALIFETGAWSLLATVLGAAASIALAYGLMWQSSKLIDESFESAATLEDRNRHSSYGKRYAFGWHNNPFMVREMAWQMRSGAGAWPGYAVFLTLFLAPFFYGLAQEHRAHEERPVRVVRQSVTQYANPGVEETRTMTDPVSGRVVTQSVHSNPEAVRYHGALCVSRLLGLPVPTEHQHDYYSRYNSLDGDQRIVVNSDGRAMKVSDSQAFSMANADRHLENRSDASFNRTYLQTELDRGLLTGLVLTLLYLFIRGGAFMSGAVTGEKERRAWDQIALTGATPESYLSGKLIGVLYYPMKQLLWTSPVLILFAIFGGVSLTEILMVVPLLIASFLAAANIGLLSSSIKTSSHQAQGLALLAAAGLLTLPLLAGGWLLSAIFVFAILSRGGVEGSLRIGSSLVTGLWVLLMGGAASPLKGVMDACQYNDGFSFCGNCEQMPPTILLLVGTVSMLLVARGAFLLSVKSLNQGGSVKA